MEELVARRLAIVPTTNCSLNCKLCMDYLSGPVKRRDIPLEDVCRDIDACFALFDRVVWLQFVGGEVFVYRDFAKLLDYALRYRDRFDRLIIETNATVFPDEAGRQALLRYGDALSIYVSDYGELSRSRGKFDQFAREHNIHYVVKKYHGDGQYFDGWIDNTNPHDLKEPGDVLEVNAMNCPQCRLRNMHCYDGKLHRCSNSCFTGKSFTGLGSGARLPKTANTLIDSPHMSRAEIRIFFLMRFAPSPAQGLACVWLIPRISHLVLGAYNSSSSASAPSPPM